MSTRKFSQFTNGNQVQVGDTVVGLRGGLNYKFSFPDIGFKDASGNYLINYESPSPSAVNNIKFISAETGQPVVVTATGSDANIGINVVLKNAGLFSINGTTGISAIINDDTMATATADNINTALAIKTYIDNQDNISSYYQPVAAASFGSPLNATYNNGSSGVGATLTGNVNGALAVDNYSAQLGDDILVGSQTPAFERGIYTVTQVGDGSNPFILTRATWYDEPSEMALGDTFIVNNGDIYEGSTFYLIFAVPVTIGVDDILFLPLAPQSPASLTQANDFEAANDFQSTFTIGSTILLDEIIDDDTFATATDTNIATAESTKAYIDNKIAMFQFLNPVKVATTGNFASTYNNGASGVGATLTATSNGAASIDGVSLSLTDRVLFKDQSTTYENGVYTVTQIGDGSNPAIYTRATDFDEPSEMTAGEIATVTEGTANANTGWLLTTTVTTVGTDPVVWIDFIPDINNVVTLSGTQTITGTKTFNSFTGTLSDALDANTNLINNLTDPVSPQDAATKNYIDAGFVSLSGTQTITGAKTFTATNTDIANFRLSGNTLSSTNINGNITLTPNGTGINQLGKDLDLNGNQITSPDGTDLIDIPNGTIDLQTNSVSRVDVTDSGVRLGGANARVTTVLTDTTMAAASDTNLYTGLATKTYIDSKATSVPTQQVFTSGSGTYTTPANVRYIKVEMTAGGGGGGGSGTGSRGNGGAGGSSTFGSSLLTALGGAGGAGSGVIGGTGGAATINSPAFGQGFTGGQGCGSGATAGNDGRMIGGAGGANHFGGAGALSAQQGSAGGTASPNTGGGGGGAGCDAAASAGGCGGGAGAYLEAYIGSPSATYSYGVGTAGAAGTAGTSGAAGGAGAAGIIIVTEYY